MSNPPGQALSGSMLAAPRPRDYHVDYAVYLFLADTDGE
jgi:hypothetical protein